MTINSVDDLLALLATGAGVDDGEVIFLLDHMLQSAALLAERAPEDTELQVAGLVHDLGWMLTDDPARHATTGAKAVEPLLGPRVAALVQGHDHAKRYLVSTDPEYRSQLSETSVVTLVFQGGDMGAEEQAEFEAHEHFASLVTLRRADDAAKVPARIVPALDTWRATLDEVAAAQA